MTELAARDRPSRLFRYIMCDQYMESDLPLLELGSGAVDEPVGHVEPLRIRARHRKDFPPPFEIDGVAYFRRRDDQSEGSEFIAEDVARITTDGTGTEIVVEHDPMADPATLSHLVVDQAVPRALSERGLLVLHATCVAVDGRGLGFLGATGTGKSTLAMSFFVDGAELVADDCLAMRETENWIVALPSYGSGRLRSDSLEALQLTERSLPGSPGKRRIVTQNNRSPCEMAALYILRREATARDPVAVRLTGTQALWAIAQHSFASNGLRSETALSALALLAPLVERLAVFDLSYGSGFDALALVRDEVLRSGRSDATPKPPWSPPFAVDPPETRTV